MEHLIEAQKWKTQKIILFILMILMPILSTVVMKYRGLGILHPTWIFNSAIDVLGMIILVLVFMGVIKDREDRTRRTGFFAYLLFFTSLELFLDQIFWAIDALPQYSTLLFIINTLIYLVGAALITTFWFYLAEVSGSDDPRLDRMAKNVNRLQTLALLGILGNCFGHYYFTADSTGKIVLGKYSVILFAYPLCIMILALILIFYLEIGKQKKKVLITFVSIPLLASLINLTSEMEISLLYPGVVCSIILIYGNVFAEANADLERKKNQLLLKENELLVSRQEQARLNTELELASEIQQHFLPMVFPPYPSIKNMDLYAVMHPAKEVGGDFYDFFLIDDTHLGLVIADVSGKGIPAALMMMITKIMIKNTASHGLSPAEVFNNVNQQLCANNDADMFVTAWFCIVDLETGLCTAANAGHEYPVFYTHGKNFDLIKDKHDLVLGGLEITQYHEYTFTLDKDDTLFVYTDGVAEAENDSHELFGTESLLKSLNKQPNADARTLIENVMKDIETFADEADQFDDITMLCFRLKSEDNI